jgi:excisionase family DNA binding protein
MTATTERRQRPAARVAADIVDALRATPDAPCRLSVGDRDYALPAELVDALAQLLDDIAEGRDVTPAPASLPIGTELASDLLGVSRPWLTTLLDRGEIPSTRVGTKRRVRLGDVLAYRRADNERRQRGLTWKFLDEA